MRIRILTVISMLIVFCCSSTYAATVGDIVPNDDPTFKECKLSGGNMFGDYVELSSIIQDGAKYSCKVASINRYTRKIVYITGLTIVQLPDNKIMIPGKSIHNLNSNEVHDRMYKEFFTIMKEALDVSDRVAPNTYTLSSELPKGTLTDDQLTLGYISIGASPQNVTQVYGQPDRVDERNGMTYFYGDSLSFSFLGVGASSLYDVTTKDKNGIKTADGIEVGMLVSKLYDVYGTPNFIRQDQDTTRYWYYWEKNKYRYFTFTVKKGVITQISLHNAD